MPSSSPTDDGRPGNGPGVDPLLRWSLASFHTALLVLVLVLVLLVTGRAGGVLGGLSTPQGILLYLALWAATWWTHGEVLQRSGVSVAGSRPPLGKLLGESLSWGAVTGAVFAWAVVLVTVLPQAPPVPFAVVFLGAGALVGVAVGGIVGVVLALLDVVLVQVGRRWAPPTGA